MPRRDRSGFALVGVLWVIVAVAALVMAGRLVAREAVLAAMNREAMERTRWVAEGCLARARAAASRATREARQASPDSTVWVALDVVVTASPLARGCELRLRPAGARLAVNEADGESFRRLFAAAGLRRGQADSLADALLDWRDADDAPRPLGAEAPAYLHAGAAPPRNGPLQNAREILRVRGFDAAGGVDSLLDVEAGPVSLNHAPAAVLATLPGVSVDAALALVRERGRSGPLATIDAVQPRVGPEAWARIVNHYPELARRVALIPERWIARVRAGEQGSAVFTEIEEVWVDGGARPAVVRHRIGSDAW